MNILKKILFFVLIVILFSCKKEDVNSFDYDAISRIVGPKGKTMIFYEAFESDFINPKNAIITLNFPEGAVENDTEIKMNLCSNSPSGFIIKSSIFAFQPQLIQLNKPVSFTFNYSKIVTNYPDFNPALHYFKPYRIKFNKINSLSTDILVISNWEKISNFTLDTLAMTITMPITSFSYMYCFAFPEISCNNIINIVTTGSQNLFLEANDGEFRCLNNVSTCEFFPFDQNNTLNVFEFSFNGSDTGIYMGNECSARLLTSWNDYSNNINCKIHISQFGLMGSQIKGTITAKLKDDSENKEIDINAVFDVTRLR